MAPTFDIRSLAGISAPLGFWDPAGFSEGKTEGTLRFYREVEIKHGRVSMLAALGFPVAEHFHPLFGGYIDVDSTDGREMGSGVGNDEGTFHTMSMQASAHTCAELCQGYEHFGVQFHNQCFCDNQFGTHGQDTSVPSGCDTPCAHSDLRTRLGRLVNQLAPDGTVLTPGYMDSCFDRWLPECDAAAASLGVAKPEICGGSWRNSVYAITSSHGR